MQRRIGAVLQENLGLEILRRLKGETRGKFPLTKVLTKSGLHFEQTEEHL